MNLLYFSCGMVSALCLVFVWAAIVGIIKAKSDPAAESRAKEVSSLLHIANGKRGQIADALNRIADIMEKKEGAQ